MDYELLSRLNCSEFGRFVRYEPTIYGSGISAYFKRKELENYILKNALETGVINHDAEMEADDTKVDIWVEHAETTLGYYWADENEPIYFIHAQIYGPLEDSHMARKKCEYSFYVCAPFSGGYQIEHNNNDEVLNYLIYIHLKTQRERVWEPWDIMELMMQIKLRVII